MICVSGSVVVCSSLWVWVSCCLVIYVCGVWLNDSWNICEKWYLDSVVILVSLLSVSGCVRYVLM